MPPSKPCKQMLDPSTNSFSVLTPSLNLKHNAEKHNAEKLSPICATGVLKQEVGEKMKSCEIPPRRPIFNRVRNGSKWDQFSSCYLQVQCASSPIYTHAPAKWTIYSDLRRYSVAPKPQP